MRDRRVLLAAMSGIRVKDQELLALGMTLPGFVERGRTVASMPSLGLLTLAARCPEGWTPSYREIDRVDEAAVDGIAGEGFDLVAVSSLTARIDDAYALADALRARGLRVVLGGLHATALPDEASEHADSVVCGEGERAWPRLLRDLDAGRLAPRYDSRSDPSLSADLDEPVVPRYDLIDPAKYNRIPLQATRGCPVGCGFCAASRLISPYKIKPVERVERELDAIAAIWPRPFIELADDNTFISKTRARELVDALSRRSLKWFTECDLSVADDVELLDMLAGSNCAQLLIGLESPRPDDLYGMDPGGVKSRLAAGCREAVRRIQERGISVNGCFIVGLDSHGPGIFAEIAEFAESAGLAEVQITLLTPFPGTALYDRLLKEGRLDSERFWDRCTLFDLTFRPAGMSPNDVREGFAGLMRTLYDEAAVARRRRRFKDCRKNRRRMHAESVRFDA